MFGDSYDLFYEEFLETESNDPRGSYKAIDNAVSNLKEKNEVISVVKIYKHAVLLKSMIYNRDLLLFIRREPAYHFILYNPTVNARCVSLTLLIRLFFLSFVHSLSNVVIRLFMNFIAKQVVWVWRCDNRWFIHNEYIFLSFSMLYEVICAPDR